jgi:hypothetical protein
MLGGIQREQQLGSSQPVLDLLLPFLSPADAGQLVLLTAYRRIDSNGPDGARFVSPACPSDFSALWPLLLDNESFASAAFFVFLAKSLRDEVASGSSEIHSWVLQQVCLRNRSTRIQSFWLLQQDHASAQQRRLLLGLALQLPRLERLRLQLQLESVQAISRMVQCPHTAAAVLAPGRRLRLPFRSLRGLHVSVIELTVSTASRRQPFRLRVRVFAEGAGTVAEEAELVVYRANHMSCRSQELHCHSMAQLGHGSAALLGGIGGQGQSWPCSTPLPLGDGVMVHLRRNLTLLSSFTSSDQKRHMDAPWKRLQMNAQLTALNLTEQKHVTDEMMQHLLSCHHGRHHMCCLRSHEYHGFFTFVLGTCHVFHGSTRTRVHHLVAAFIDNRAAYAARVFRQATAFLSTACFVLGLGNLHPGNLAVNDLGQLQLAAPGRAGSGQEAPPPGSDVAAVCFDALVHPVLGCMGAPTITERETHHRNAPSRLRFRFSWIPFVARKEESQEGTSESDSDRDCRMAFEKQNEDGVDAFEKALAPFVHDVRHVMAACPLLLACCRLLPREVLEDAEVDHGAIEARLGRLRAPDLAMGIRLGVERHIRPFDNTVHVMTLE